MLLAMDRFSTSPSDTNANDIRSDMKERMERLSDESIIGVLVYLRKSCFVDFLSENRTSHVMGRQKGSGLTISSGNDNPVLIPVSHASLKPALSCISPTEAHATSSSLQSHPLDDDVP